MAAAVVAITGMVGTSTLSRPLSRCNDRAAGSLSGHPVCANAIAVAVAAIAGMVSARATPPGVADGDRHAPGIGAGTYSGTGTVLGLATRDGGRRSVQPSATQPAVRRCCGHRCRTDSGSGTVLGLATRDRSAHPASGSATVPSVRSDALGIGPARRSRALVVIGIRPPAWRSRVSGANGNAIGSTATAVTVTHATPTRAKQPPEAGARVSEAIAFGVG